MNVVVVSLWIFTSESILDAPFWNGSPVGQPTARGGATVPRPPQTAALGVAGERTGANAELGERGASKGVVPGRQYGGGL